MSSSSVLLRNLFEKDEIVCVRMIETWEESGRKQSHNHYTLWFTLTDLEAYWDRLLEESQQTRANVFFGVCPRVEKGKDKQEDIRHLRALWADMDFKDYDIIKTPQAALEHIARNGLPTPSYTVATGHGVHVYWLLDQVVDVRAFGLERIKGLLKGIARKINSDHTTDISRLLRIPGTYNRKNERNGQEPILCEIFQDTGGIYTIEEIERLTEDKSQSSASAPPSRVISNVEMKATRNPANDLQTASLLAKAATAPVGQRSETDYAVVAKLVEKGMGKDGIWETVKEVGKFAERGEAYFDNTYKNAAANVQAKVKASVDTGLQPTDPTDIGNADKFVSLYGDQLRYVRQWKKWICWNGFYWQTLFNEQVISTLVYPFVRNTLPALAAQITDDDKRKKWYQWVASSQSANRTNAIAEMAGNMLSVNVEEIKTDPWLFACENAIIDLRTQQRVEPQKGQWITYLAPIQYNPSSTCPAWDHFIADIFVNADFTPCPDLVEYVHRALGYCLTSSVEEQVFFIAHGVGKNGKSTLFEALQGIMGEYAVTGDSTLYFERRDQSNSEDIARLWHKHLCITAETQQGSKLSDSKIKRLTGGDRLTASRKYEHTFDFAPTHKLVLLCNFLPRINVTDPALLRRIKIIPFYYVVPEDKRDNNLKEKLTAEASGILNWLLAGLAKWQTTKLFADKNTPAICRAAKEGYVEDNDSLLDFRNECLTTAKGDKEEKAIVFLRYCTWAEMNGVSHKLSAKGLTEKLTLAGYKDQQSNGKRYWLDIQVSNPG